MAGRYRSPPIAVTAIGEGPGPAAEIVDALTLATPVASLTSRAVGGYVAALIAQTLGRRLRVATEPGGFRISCVERGA